MSIMRFCLIMLWCGTLTAITSEKKYTIMIDPAGDAKHTGRIISDTFERAITLSIAQDLERALTRNPNCTVIITRSAGETVSPLQHANFSNRLPVDLFINLNCYQSEEEPFSLSLYSLSLGEPCMPSSRHTFLPFDKAHHISADRTKRYANAITQRLHSQNAHSMTVHGPFAIPCAPLIGITAPALMIELCLTGKNSYTACIDPLAYAIIGALTS